MLRKVDKISKIVATILLVVMILAMVGTSVFATNSWNVSVTPNTDTDGATEITTLGGKVVGIMQVVGYVIAVVVLVYIGIKWITSSPEGKAEVKKIALYYVLGAVVIAAAVTIVGVVFNFGTTAISK